MKPSFTLFEPESLSEASSVLEMLGPRARCYAGGVRLLLDMREGRAAPETLVNLKRIPELTTLEHSGGGLRIGACVSQARASVACREVVGLSVVADMIDEIGNVRVRNMATLGGNLAVADPHADPATPLMLLDADVDIFGPTGQRRVSLASFQQGPFMTALQDGEFIAAIHVRPLPAPWSATYHRVQRLLPPTLTVAAAAAISGGRLDDVRLAVGSVSSVALRLHDLEDELRGLAPSEVGPLIESRAADIDALVEPSTDPWGSADYKSYITRTVLRRAVIEAADSARTDGS